MAWHRLFAMCGQIWHWTQSLRRQTKSYSKEHCSLPLWWAAIEWIWHFLGAWFWHFLVAFVTDLAPSACRYLSAACRYPSAACYSWVSLHPSQGEVSHKCWGCWRNPDRDSICTRRRWSCLCLSSLCRSVAHSQSRTSRRRHKGSL